MLNKMENSKIFWKISGFGAFGAIFIVPKKYKMLFGIYAVGACAVYAKIATEQKKLIDSIGEPTEPQIITREGIQ